MLKEKKEKDFLKRYYQHNRAIHEAEVEKETNDSRLQDSNAGLEDSMKRHESEDWPVELDSDEEPLSIYQAFSRSNKPTVRDFLALAATVKMNI